MIIGLDDEFYRVEFIFDYERRIWENFFVRIEYINIFCEVMFNGSCCDLEVVFL